MNEQVEFEKMISFYKTFIKKNGDWSSGKTPGFISPGDPSSIPGSLLF